MVTRLALVQPSASLFVDEHQVYAALHWRFVRPIRLDQGIRCQTSAVRQKRITAFTLSDKAEICSTV